MKKINLNIKHRVSVPKVKFPNAFVNRKFLLISLLAVALPLITAAAFFYGNFNLSSLSATLQTSSQEDVLQDSEENTRSALDLRLVPREDFLEKYSTKPSYLPMPMQMQTTLSGFMRSNSSAALLPARNWSVPFQDIPATSAIAVEMPTNRILYGKDVFDVRPIASISKLVTAIVAQENIASGEVVTISQSAVDVGGASGGITAGSKLTAEQLMYAIMLESSNSAAVALEEHYNENRPEGAPDFVELMNQKVVEWGINDTNFSEPTGLSPENTSSAASVAKILYQASLNSEVKKAMSASSYTASPQNQDHTHYWINLNALLEAYEGVIGGKTGYTDEAGPSLTVLAQTPNPDNYLVIVVLDADNRIDAATDLLNWVRSAYIWEE